MTDPDVLTLHVDELSWLFVICRVKLVVDVSLLHVGDLRGGDDEACAYSTLKMVLLKTKKR